MWTEPLWGLNLVLKLAKMLCIQWNCDINYYCTINLHELIKNVNQKEIKKAYKVINDIVLSPTLQ